MTKKYEDYTREQLLEEIKKLKKQKKFGLVWEEKTEEVVEQCKTNFPVLHEISERAISGNDSPTHLILEGDNYHSLSVLNVTHKGKIDVIYIDPPYNTGNKDFKYNDSFVDKEDCFRHSKWISFMNKRLKLAKELLSEKGVIFISIDDNEQAHLKLLCDEIYGTKNFVDAIIWKKTENIKMDSKFLSQNKDFILCYRKSDKITDFTKEQSTEERFKLEDEKGKYYLRKLDSLSSTYSKGMDYVIEHNGVKYYAGGSKEKYEERQLTNPGKKAPTWLWSKAKFEQGVRENEIVFKNGNIYNKVRFDGIAKKPYVNIQTLASGQTAQKELDDMFGKRFFDHPKPPKLIKWVIELASNKKNLVILDFFAGSGTTGHAVLELNKEDGGNRQFILCTNNENNICEEVTYPRIKTVITGQRPDGTKYADKIPANVRYFKTDFVEKSEDTDENRIRLTNRCYELLQIKESCYDKQNSKVENLKIWRNEGKLLAVIFDRYDNTDDKKYISEIAGFAHNSDEVVVYRFSIDGNLDMDISALPNARLEEIPEEILKTFNQIFKTKKKRK
ncbi:MAG: site-specific DNA-methyltransferase [Flavobacteriaceae bacterium]